MTSQDRFEVFWRAYPRRIGKDAALRVWNRLKVDDALLGDMLHSLENQKASRQWRRDGGQYIPHPRTWLNQGRWKDEIEPFDAPRSAIAEATEAFLRGDDA